MATSTHRYRRLGIALTLLTFIAAAVLLAGALTASPASAQVTVDDFEVADHDKTVTGDVTGVGVETTLAFDHAVPDATSRIVKLHVGPSESDLESVAFARERSPTGDDAGQVTLSGDLTDHAAWSASDFDPATASSVEREVVVQATLTLERENGDAVTRTVTDTATITLTDGTELDATLGGDGTFTVETA